MKDARLRFALIALAYASIGAVLAALLGTWTDEEYTLATTAHGIPYAIERALNYELQAPLYFAVLAAWRSLDGSVWFARLFSVLCATAFLLVIARIGRRIAPKTDPLPFALLAALNPFVVYAAFDIRLYALALLLSAMLWLAFDAGFARGANTRARIAFVLLAIAAIYVQYFLGFMLIGFGCALLVLRRRRSLGAYLAYCTIVALAVLPLALEAKHQAGAYQAAAPPLLGLLRAALVHPWLDFVLPYDHVWDAVPYARLLYGLIVVATVALLVAGRPVLTRATIALLASAVAIELVYVALSAAVRLPLQPLYFVALYVPLASALYAAVNDFAPGRRAPAVALFAIIATLSAAVLAAEYRHLAQPGDWKRVAAYLEENARPNDAVAVFPPDGLPALLRAYRDVPPAVPYPHAESNDVYSVASVSVRSASDALAGFEQLSAHHVIWFVMPPCDANDPQYGCRYVQSTLAAHFQLLSQRAFYENDVYELSALVAPTRSTESARKTRAQPGGNVAPPR